MPGQRSISFFGFKCVAPHTRTSLQFLGFQASICEGYGRRQLVEHVHVLLQPRVVSLHLTANRSTSASPGALTVHLCSSSLTSLSTVGVPTFCAALQELLLVGQCMQGRALRCPRVVDLCLGRAEEEWWCWRVRV